ncbi:cytochrome c [candidate division KSB1 bacterium]|nr:cytochrome c [candidate division KSB1 bacterium]
MKKLLISAAMLSTLMLVGCDHHKPDTHNVIHNEVDMSATPVELKLSPKFQNVLKKEMLEIQTAMQKILPLLAKGESEKTAQLAKQIHNSFILKQTLTPDELKALVKLLPAPFIKIDRAFHDQASKLAKAAKQSNFKKSSEIYGRLVNACVNCHSQFAHELFPGLKKTTTQ